MGQGNARTYHKRAWFLKRYVCECQWARLACAIINANKNTFGVLVTLIGSSTGSVALLDK